MFCNECYNAINNGEAFVNVKYNMKYEPVCLTCAIVTDWLHEGMIIHIADSKKEEE